MPETPNAEPITQDDVIKNLDAFFGTTPEGDDEEDDKTAKGGGNEPKSGESESDEEQDEAESESDDEQDDEDSESQDASQKVKVKVDGEELEITLDEAIAGYSREADYRRRTQSHAEAVSKWEATKEENLKAERADIAAKREQYISVLGVWEQNLKQALGSNEELEHLRLTDRVEYAARMAERYALHDQIRDVQARLAHEADADKATQETARKQRVSSEAQKLIDAVPEWKDAAKWKEDGAQIYAYAAKYGISEKELNDIADHRVMRVLHDAARYKALQEKKPAAIKRVETAKPLPPGNASTQPLSPASRLNKLADIQSRRGDKASTVALFETLLR